MEILSTKVKHGLQILKENSDTIIKQLNLRPTERHLVVKELYPQDLKEVALLMFALPPTQCSVERIFSSLKLLKSDLRNRLKEDIVDSIIFLRCNKIGLKHSLKREIKKKARF